MMRVEDDVGRHARRPSRVVLDAVVDPLEGDAQPDDDDDDDDDLPSLVVSSASCFSLHRQDERVQKQ